MSPIHWLLVVNTWICLLSSKFLPDQEKQFGNNNVGFIAIFDLELIRN